VRRPPAFEETLALAPEELGQSLRAPRRRRSGIQGDTAENLAGDQ
jgi:hypothetical protein